MAPPLQSTIHYIKHVEISSTIFYLFPYFIVMFVVVGFVLHVRGEEYDRSNKGLTEIPTDIPAGATEVTLIGNRITTIRAGSFSHLARCEKLRLGNNQISEIGPAAFTGLTSLTHLFLDTNKLTHISPGTFSHLARCEVLWLNNNQISEINPAAFTGLSSLRYLYLYTNKLTHISPGTFSTLTSLRELYLSTNKLTHISPGTFSGLTSLHTLRLHNNRLTGLSSNLFLDLPRPLTLLLGDPDNAFLCDESLCWLKQEEQDGTVRFEYWGAVYRPKCSNSISRQSFTCSSGKIH